MVDFSFSIHNLLHLLEFQDRKAAGTPSFKVMLRRKRYLLPEENDMQIPPSTKRHRRKCDQDARRTSINNFEIENSDLHDAGTSLSLGHTETSQNPLFQNEEGTSIPPTDSVMELKDVSKAKITSAEEFETLLLYGMTKHGWTQESVKDIFSIIKSLPKDDSFEIPSASKFLKRHCSNHESVRRHFTCPKCNMLLIEATLDSSDVFSTQSAQKVYECSQCNEKFTEDFLKQKDSYFVTFPLDSVLKEFLESDYSDAHLSQPNDDGTLSSVVDGLRYNQLKNQLNLSADDFTFTMHVDGVPLFNSSKKSMWPVLLSINELKEKERKESIFVAGIWISKRKPDTNVFLLQVIKELKQLEKGISWTHPLTKNVCISRFFTIICTADAVARSHIRNMTLFNGRHGCGQCCHPGEVVSKGRGHCRVYPFSDSMELRSNDETSQLARVAHDTEEVCYGIFDLNPFMLLNGFFIVDSFVFDYMHTLMLGITKAMFSLWFDKSNFRQPWYVGKANCKVNQRLVSMTPPSEVQRNPRSLEERKFYKASEWTNTLLFYSYATLDGILETAYFQHFILLIELTHLALKNAISSEELRRIDDLSTEFIRGVESLYGKQHCSYNVHQLSHISVCIKNWGPLNMYSCFAFETYLGRMKKAIHSGNRPMEQAINYVHRMRRVGIMVEPLKRNKNDVAVKVGLIKAAPCSEGDQLKVSKKVAFTQIVSLYPNSTNYTDSTDYYLKFFYKDTTILSYAVQEGRKNCDSYILLKDGTCCKSMYLAICDQVSKLYVRVLKSEPVQQLPAFLCRSTPDVKEFSLSDLQEKLFHVKKNLSRKCFYLFRNFRK